MSIYILLCLIWGILVGIIGVKENENIFKIVLASGLGYFAISFWFN